MLIVVEIGVPACCADGLKGHAEYVFVAEGITDRRNDVFVVDFSLYHRDEGRRDGAFAEVRDCGPSYLRRVYPAQVN